MTNFLFNFLDFDSDFYNFQRSIKDMKPYEVVKTNDKSTVVFNVLGLSKENISVTVEKQRGTDYLVISGEQKNEITNKTYSVNGRFIIDVNEVKNIEWRVKDGLLYIDVYFKQPEKPLINIKYRE